MHHKINKNHEPTLWALKNSLMLMLSLLSVSISLKSASTSSAESFSPVSFTPSVNSFRLKPLLPSSSILRNTLRHVKQHIYQNNNTSSCLVYVLFLLTFSRNIELLRWTTSVKVRSQTRIYVLNFPWIWVRNVFLQYLWPVRWWPKESINIWACMYPLLVCRVVYSQLSSSVGSMLCVKSNVFRLDTLCCLKFSQ